MGLLSGLLDVVYPPACLGCGTLLEATRDFCSECELTVERLEGRPACPRCGEPRPQLETCVRCRSQPPPFSRAFSAFLHQGAVARAVHRFKYEDHPELAPGLVELLAYEGRDFLLEAPSTLCAIPLHPRRFRARTYDQARLLAGCLGRLTGRSVLHHALRRTRVTRRQVGLDEKGRELNVAAAFAADADAVRNRSILLLDDVFTTGATARAAAHALKVAGAAEVAVVTLARAAAG